MHIISHKFQFFKASKQAILSSNEIRNCAETTDVVFSCGMCKPGWIPSVDGLRCYRMFFFYLF